VARSNRFHAPEVFGQIKRNWNGFSDSEGPLRRRRTHKDPTGWAGPYAWKDRMQTRGLPLKRGAPSPRPALVEDRRVWAGRDVHQVRG
jgi:hypothetical protein